MHLQKGSGYAGSLFVRLIVTTQVYSSRVQGSRVETTKIKRLEDIEAWQPILELIYQLS